MSTLSPESIELASTAIEHAIARANAHFERRFPIPTLSFKLRGKAAGKAYLLDNQIRLNPVLFAQNQKAFLEEVIPHEVAHLVVFQLFGKVRPHGKEWQFVMQEVLKVPATTRHSFDVTSVMGKTFSYQCACTTHQLTIRRHNKILRQQVSYRCKDCGQELKPAV